MVFEGSERGFGDWLLHLWQQPLIAVIRLCSSPDQALQGSTLAIRAGIRHIEITPHVPRYLELIAQLRQDHPQCWIGVGTVSHRQMAEQAWQAGAQFCVCPFTDESIIRWGREVGLPVVPGALTPSEIWKAWQAGATAVKVFPAESMGGSRYLRHLRPVLGSLPLIPTGGDLGQGSGISASRGLGGRHCRRSVSDRGLGSRLPKAGKSAAPGAATACRAEKQKLAQPEQIGRIGCVV